jgi:hypothetical protein
MADNYQNTKLGTEKTIIILKRMKCLLFYDCTVIGQESRIIKIFCKYTTDMETLLLVKKLKVCNNR